MGNEIIPQSPQGDHPEQTSEQASELVVRFGEYELTLYPEDQRMVLCEKGGRVCIEHIQDEHIFRFLYELLTEYAQGDEVSCGEREVQ